MNSKRPLYLYSLERHARKRRCNLLGLAVILVSMAACGVMLATAF